MQLLAILVTFLAIATLSLSFSTSSSSSWSLYLRRKAISVNKLSSSDNTDTSSSSSTTSYPCPNAPKCNGSYRTKGCDGSGKIKGGLGALPGFDWVGAKVYRPCPAFLQAGYIYEREGQTLEQVLFSEPSTKMKQRYESQRTAQQQEEVDTNTSTVTEEQQRSVEQTVEQVKKEGNNGDDDNIERIYKERFGPGKQ
eukprot:gene1264-1379_t